MSHEFVDPNTKPQEPSAVWTTVFEINPDEALTVQRIVDTLRNNNHPTIDPKIIEDEAEEFWGP